MNANQCWVMLKYIVVMVDNHFGGGSPQVVGNEILTHLLVGAHKTYVNV